MGKMSGINPETEELGWTKGNLETLLAAMKASIPEQNKYFSFTKGMKDMAWKKIAFPPFSPKECQEKWLEMYKKMRKFRSLTELITEAEEVISSSPDALKKYQKPSRKRKRKVFSGDTPDDESSENEEGMPPKPPVNGYGLFCKEQVDITAKKDYLNLCAQRWRDLTEDEREEINKRYSDLKRQYLKTLDKYLKSLNRTKRNRIIEKHGIKRSKFRASMARRFPGEPIRPARSGNIIFIKKHMDSLKEDFPDSKKRFAKISQMWNNLSDAEKRHYREKIVTGKRNYIMELHRWFKTLKPEERDDYLKFNPGQLRYLEYRPVRSKKKENPQRPSDSEDEVTENSSSSDEEQSKSAYKESEEEEEEEEEEDEDDDIAFNMY